MCCVGATAVPVVAAAAAAVALFATTEPAVARIPVHAEVESIAFLDATEATVVVDAVVRGCCSATAAMPSAMVAVVARRPQVQLIDAQMKKRYDGNSPCKPPVEARLDVQAGVPHQPTTMKVFANWRRRLPALAHTQAPQVWNHVTRC